MNIINTTIFMIKLSGVIEKRDGLFVIMLPDEIAEKEKFKDGEKVNMLFIKNKSTSLRA